MNPPCKCHGVPTLGDGRCRVTKKFNDEKYDRTPKGRANIRRKRLREACKRREISLATIRERFFS